MWLVASEYVITEVDSVTYPNRLLRDEGLLQVKLVDEKELIDFEHTHVWALVDHQFSHVFVKNSDPALIERAKACLKPYFAEVLDREEQTKYQMGHERSGDLVVISHSNSWQAYYWWNDDSMAPDFAHTVDIHRKPGYDPVELCFDMATKRVPLDATLIKGSHGVPSNPSDHQGVVLTSSPMLNSKKLSDTDLFQKVLGYFCS